MPWKATDAMSEKKLFIKEWLHRHGRTVVDLAVEFGVHRKTAHKWIARFREEGMRGLAERSRRPQCAGSHVDAAALEVLLALRNEHPNWGPRKLLLVADKELKLPSHATLSRLFKERGLTLCKSKRRHRPEKYQSKYDNYYGPNACWSVDYKGPMELATPASYCHPLTIKDVTSRFVLRCTAMPRISRQGALRTFRSAFTEYGLPDAIRSDNGVPFAGNAPGGLSELSIWWLKLGIVLNRGRPGTPTDNARHERMHRTLNEEAKRGRTIAEQQRHFDCFRLTYNTKRPHQALNNRVPADVYVSSVKRYPVRLRDPKYEDRFFPERLGTRGNLRFMGTSDCITPLLGKELVGLLQIEPRIWEVYFGTHYLGFWNKKGFQKDKKFRQSP